MCLNKTCFICSDRNTHCLDNVRAESYLCFNGTASQAFSNYVLRINLLLDDAGLKACSSRLKTLECKIKINARKTEIKRQDVH